MSASDLRPSCSRTRTRSTQPSAATPAAFAACCPTSASLSTSPTCWRWRCLSPHARLSRTPRALHRRGVRPGFGPPEDADSRVSAWNGRVRALALGGHLATAPGSGGRAARPRDIPYFFRLYGRPGILLLRGSGAPQGPHDSARGRRSAPRPSPSTLARPAIADAQQKLRDEGLFALLGAFDHLCPMGGPARERRFPGDLQSAHHRHEALPTGEELHARRNIAHSSERLPALPLRRGAIGFRASRHEVRHSRVTRVQDKARRSSLEASCKACRVSFAVVRASPAFAIA